MPQRFEGFESGPATPPPFRSSVPPPMYRRKPARSIESQIFWGILLAVLVLSGLSAVGYAIRVAVARSAIEQIQATTLQAIHDDQARYDAQQRQHQAQQAAQDAYERSRRTLASNQECVGGAVVQVEGHSYTQVGSLSQPVHCMGRMADVPLR